MATITTPVKWCGGCREEKPTWDFNITPMSWDKLYRYCKACMERSKGGILLVNEKECSLCRERKPVSDYYNDTQSRDGYGSRCSQCTDSERVKQKDSPSKPRTRASQRRESVSDIRQRDQEMRLQAMLTAPSGLTNTPLLKRLSKIMELLHEISKLDPELAATMMPVTRCREFTTPEAEWLLRLTALCEQRVIDEMNL